MGAAFTRALAGRNYSVLAVSRSLEPLVSAVVGWAPSVQPWGGAMWTVGSKVLFGAGNSGLAP